MDVLGVRKMLYGAISKLNVIEDGLMHAKQTIVRVFCAVFIASSRRSASVSITAAAKHQRNERLQHIRSFQYAFACGRCRCGSHPDAMRALRR